MRHAAISSAGGRDENQDAQQCRTVGEALIACVCDGLGGHAGGGAAAQIALSAAMSAQGGLDARVCAANDAVISGQKTCSAMRTTIVLLMLEGNLAKWAHCGDTRLYRIRGGKAERLTCDHSVPQALARVGEIQPEQIRGHEDRARLTRALGAQDCKWDEGQDEILPGDIFLLATDGFWEPVLEEDMENCLCGEPEEYVKRMEARLLARVDGRYDNYTALVVFA